MILLAILFIIIVIFIGSKKEHYDYAANVETTKLSLNDVPYMFKDEVPVDGVYKLDYTPPWFYIKENMIPAYDYPRADNIKQLYD